MNDSKVFKSLIVNITQRIGQLGLKISDHTFVFDRGNNSEKNLSLVDGLGIAYVGALTPYQHKQLVEMAREGFEKTRVDDLELDCYRTKTQIWGQDRTVVVFLSDRLKSGQIRGLYQQLEKAEKQLTALQEKISGANARKRNKRQLTQQIGNILKDKTISLLLSWELKWVSKGKYLLTWQVDQGRLQTIEDGFGFRILMTNRHTWDTGEIINAFYGQSKVEEAFKRLKNTYHLPVRPQFHWTDQKIKVHNFICITGYLLATLALRELRLSIQFKGNISTMCNTLKNIRLVSLLENKNKQLKAIYKLEEMNEQEAKIFDTLELTNLHNEKPKFNGFSVYN